MAEQILITPASRVAKTFLETSSFQVQASLDAQNAWAEYQSAIKSGRQSTLKFPAQICARIKSSDIGTQDGNRIAFWIDRSVDGVVWEHFVAATYVGGKGIPLLMGGWDGNDALFKITCAVTLSAEVGIGIEVIPAVWA